MRVREQRARGLQLIGMAIKNAVFVTFVGLVDHIVKQVFDDLIKKALMCIFI